MLSFIQDSVSGSGISLDLDGGNTPELSMSLADEYVENLVESERPYLCSADML